MLLSAVAQGLRRSRAHRLAGCDRSNIWAYLTYDVTYRRDHARIDLRVGRGRARQPGSQRVLRALCAAGASGVAPRYLHNVLAVFRASCWVDMLVAPTPEEPDLGRIPARGRLRR